MANRSAVCGLHGISVAIGRTEEERSVCRRLRRPFWPRLCRGTEQPKGCTLRTLAVIVSLLANIAPGFADPTDDYVACLVGRSAVALNQQTGAKDAAAAQKLAYSHCKKPKGLNPDESEGLLDFVNIAVEAIARGVWPDSSK